MSGLTALVCNYFGAELARKGSNGLMVIPPRSSKTSAASHTNGTAAAYVNYGGERLAASHKKHVEAGEGIISSWSVLNLQLIGDKRWRLELRS